jgi:hypothetical protein
MAAAAPVATLVDVSGPVLVDSGKGFVKVSSAVDLKAGTRVLVSKDGRAVLSYSDGCAMTLSPNSITSVVTGNACATPEKATVASQNANGQQDYRWLGYIGAGVLGGVVGYLIGDNNDNGGGSTTTINNYRTVIIYRPPPPISF